MSRLYRLMRAAILLALTGPMTLGKTEDPVPEVLAAGQQALLDSEYARAIRILRSGLKNHPDDNRLRLELGRAYLSNGSNHRAILIFREILRSEPENRLAELDLARALGYDRQFESSNEIYRRLLIANGGDEAAAIGLASNLLHQRRSTEVRDVVENALLQHPNSLRLQEYWDRIESGTLSGEEPDFVARPNLAEMTADYVNDSAGNHSWGFRQRLDLGITPALTNRLLLEEQVQHSLDDPFEVVQSFTNGLRGKAGDSFLLSAGGGAVRFGNGEVSPLYDASVAFQPIEHLLFDATFSRVPVVPDAEATEHRLMAQGWETFVHWTPEHWRIDARWSQQHYSDENLATRQSAEVIREWALPWLTIEAGYRYRHVAFEQQLEHGYFSPDDYHSHLAMVGARYHLGKRYQGSFLARSGSESIASGGPFRTAWEIHSQNEVMLGNWTINFDYSKYRMVQSSGAFRADAAQIALNYRF